MPWALLCAGIVVCAVEFVFYRIHERFADLAAWQWETKNRLLAENQLQGEVVIFGDSILFHGIDPKLCDRVLHHKTNVTNLALNGQTLQHSTQLLEKYCEESRKPKLVILELWNLKVEQESWLRGPYFRFWATTDEFLQSKCYYWNPSLLVPFESNRIFVSYRYQKALDNWIFASIKGSYLDNKVKKRNQAVAVEMEDHNGFVRSTFENQILSLDDVPVPTSRPWHIHESAEIWLHRFLNICERRKLSVVLLIPPAPFFIVNDQNISGFNEGLATFLSELQQKYPSVNLRLLRFTDYQLDDFCDDHHLSQKGRQRLTHDFADWLKDNSSRWGNCH